MTDITKRLLWEKLNPRQDTQDETLRKLNNLGADAEVYQDMIYFYFGNHLAGTICTQPYNKCPCEGIKLWNV